MKYILSQIKNKKTVNNDKKLLTLLYQIEDANTYNQWRNAYNGQELDLIEELFNLYQLEDKGFPRFSPVYLLKEMNKEWRSWKDNDKVKDLLKIVVKRYEKEQG